MMSGAIFGVFLAWVCTTMWGLDSTDPRVAIEAMNAMNDSVSNPLFFAVFFLTPVVLAGAAAVAHLAGERRSAHLFGAAAIVIFFGCTVLTASFSVPMNDDLAAVAIPASVEEAQIVWDDYSGPWQLGNAIRTMFCGLGLALAAAAHRLTGRS